LIRKLRIKFICVIMSIVMVLLGCILGVVIHFTERSMEIQSINMMDRIASRPFQKGLPGLDSEEVRLPFFTVQVSRQGKMTAVSGDYFDLSDREFLQQIVDDAMDSGLETGKLEKHNLRFLKSVSPKGFTVVFSDTTTETATMKQLIYSCLAIFLVSTVVFFGISILLSRWVIKPVETAWNQQRQFVADASHELKTPLSVIMANAELMQTEETDAADSKKYANNILNVTYQMRSLVENMLEMARVDSGTTKMNITRLDYSQLVSDTVLSFQLLYEEQGLGLHCTVPEGISLKGSEQHLYQVMDILLDNALKYSTPGGAVNVDLVSYGRNCVLTVSSPGEPLSPEELKNIFKRFYRADKARSMNGSYGLGLSIAESIVEAHKGKIWAESKEGRNSFFVQLPVSEA